MGLCNATSTFMTLKDFILRRLSDFAAAYIDDIIVFSRSSKKYE